MMIDGYIKRNVSVEKDDIMDGEQRYIKVSQLCHFELSSIDYMYRIGKIEDKSGNRITDHNDGRTTYIYAVAVSKTGVEFYISKNDYERIQEAWERS